MNKVYIGLGSNRGNRETNLKLAIEKLAEKAGMALLVSSIFETQPWQMNDATHFLNQVILVETQLSAFDLMKAILEIEETMGRIRTKGTGYEPRTIDIDILFFNEDILHCDTLVIPHPHLHKRRFVLEPLAEIAPEYLHPELKKSMKELLAGCTDGHSITKLVSK